jgi:hypothetical protein
LLTQCYWLSNHLVTQEWIQAKPGASIACLQIHASRSALPLRGYLAADAHKALSPEVLQLHNITVVERSPVAVA